MNKKELEFRKILEVLDNDFANYMLDKDFKMLEIDGLARINTFEFKKTYWSKPTEEVTSNPNANMGNTGYNKSFVNLISEMATPINKLSGLYLIRKYGNKINNNGDNLVKSFIDGDVYIHNLSFFETCYCIGLSLYPLLTDGLSFNDLKSNPPKRPSSFINQTGKYIQYAANCFAGATALTDFFPNYSYFTMKQSGYTDKERENDIQNLIFCLNDKMRLGLQSPFSNVSILGPDTMRFMFQNYLWGTDSKIDDLMDEIMRNQTIYARFIAKGQIGGNGKPKGLPYRFPVTTLVAEKSFKREYPEIWEEILKDNANLCHLNILNSYDENLKSLSMCCRLQPSLEDLLKINTNGTFGSFLQIGSHAVVTINLPRIAYEAKGNMDEYLRILEKRMDKAREILHIHRVEILSKRRLKYHYFFAKKYLDLNKNFFSTIGFVGLPNAIEIMGTKIIEPDGLEMAKKILSFMKKKTVEYSQELGVMFNIEEIPAESASGSLAQKDKILFKGSYDFYDNQFVPLSYDIDVFKRIDIEGELQKDCTGGSISHINLDGKPDPNALYDFTNKILENSNLKQFAFNAGFTVCKDGHTNMGVYKQCPTCNSIDVDWVTRIVGYFTNVSAWNRLKKLEFTTRKWNKIT